MDYINYQAAELRFASTGQNHFYGYYASTPFSDNGERILAHRTNCTSPLIEKSDRVEIGWFDLETAAYEMADTTHAANWQQGSMLQWLPGHAETIIWNDFSGDHLGCFILNLVDGTKRWIENPFYAIRPDGLEAMTLNFERITHVRRSYGYPGLKTDAWQDDVVAGDGLFRLDLSSGIRSLAIPIERIRAHDPTPLMHNSLHWLDHPMYSPDGRFVAFYHRWQGTDGSLYSRLYTLDIDADRLCLYPNTGMYSHLYWINNSEFIVFGRKKADPRITGGSGLRTRLIQAALPLYRRCSHLPLIASLRGKVIIDAYMVFSADDPVAKSWGTTLPNVDGHPSINPCCPSQILTDTYPDNHDRRHLYIHDRTNDLLTELASFAAPGETGSAPDRCDLHPRWSRDGRFVCVDSRASGNRQIYVLEIGKL